MKLEKAAVFSSGWTCWFNVSMQFCFMTDLLMRWQVIPAILVVFFVIDLISATEGKNNDDDNNNMYVSCPQ